MLLQHLQAKGINLWKVQNFMTITPVVGVNSYTLPTTVVDVLEAYIRQPAGNSSLDLKMRRISRDEYWSIPQKTQQGSGPWQYYLDRQRDAPVMYVWPSPSAPLPTIFYSGYLKFFDAAELNQTLDVPTRWLPVIQTGLAYFLCQNRPALATAERRTEITNMWKEISLTSEMEDRDSSPLRLAPDLTSYVGGATR